LLVIDLGAAQQGRGPAALCESDPRIVHKTRNHAIVINLGGDGIHLVHAVMLSGLGDRLDVGLGYQFLRAPRLTPGVFGEAALNEGGVEIYEMYLHYGIDEPDFWQCDYVSCSYKIYF